MSERWLWFFILLGSALSLALSYEIATQSLRLGSLEWGWTYSYGARFSSRPVGAALIVSGVAVALLLLTGDFSHAGRRRQWLIVAAWIALATPLQALMRSLTPSDLESIFLSDAANSFYSVTQDYGARKVLNDFNDVRASWPLHAQSNMPGKLMLLYALQLVTTSPSVLPWTIVFVSNLGAALIYLFTRDLFNDGRVALISAILYLFVPAKIFFFPLLNTVTPVLIIGCAWLLLRMLQTKQQRYAALLGAALYAVAFFEPLPLVMGLLFAALVARALWLRTISGRVLLEHLGVGCVAFATSYAAMYLWFGFDLIDAFRRIGSHAVEFNVQNARPYEVWLTENLWEFVVGMGVCQAVVFFAALLDGVSPKSACGPSERPEGSEAKPSPRARSAWGWGPKRTDDWRIRLTRPITVLCLGLLAVVGVTDLIGVNRGEVIRLWIFLACLFQIPAAYICVRLQSQAAVVLLLTSTVLQAALGTAMIAFLITS
jgi:hypothetical protein